MNTIVQVKFGSWLYGTNTENSDLDLKSIYIPTFKDLVLETDKPNIQNKRNKAAGERNTKDDVDEEIFSLKRYFDLLVEGQTVATDILFANEESLLKTSDAWELIQNNRSRLVHKDLLPFIGYAERQSSKYGQRGFRVAALRQTLEWLKAQENPYNKLGTLDVQGFVLEANNKHICITGCKGPNGTTEPHLEVCNRKLPYHASIKHVTEVFKRLFDEYGTRSLLAEKNEGCDWKALSHAVRVSSQAIELLSTGHIAFPRPDRELLLKIKTGQMHFKDVSLLIEQGLEDAKAALAASTLPGKADIGFINDLLLELHRVNK